MRILSRLGSAVVFALVAAATALGSAAESALDDQLFKLTSYLHEQRGPASAEAFAAFETANDIFTKVLSSARETLPKELTPAFDASLATSISSWLSEARVRRTSDYRCYTLATRLLQQSQSIQQLQITARRMDLAHLVASGQQYDELLKGYLEKAGAESPESLHDPIPQLLRGARQNVFGAGFGVVLTEAQRQEFAALLAAHAERLKELAPPEGKRLRGADRRRQRESMRESVQKVMEWFFRVEGAKANGLVLRVVQLKWSHEHGAFEQSVYAAQRNAQAAEEAAEEAEIQREIAENVQPPAALPVERPELPTP